MSELIHTKVRGVSSDERQEFIKNQLKESSEIILIPEPENKYNKNAIAIFVHEDNEAESFKLGYLKDELASEISEKIKKGYIVSAIIQRITGGRQGKYFGVNIDMLVETLEENSESEFNTREKIDKRNKDRELGEELVMNFSLEDFYNDNESYNSDELEDDSEKDNEDDYDDDYEDDYDYEEYTATKPSKASSRAKPETTYKKGLVNIRASQISSKSKTVLLILWAIFGIFGGHHFYAGKKTLGFVYLFTGGLVLLGWGFDLVMILLNQFKDSKGKSIVNW